MPRDVAVYPLHRISGGERQLSCQHLVKSDPERIEIALDGDLATGDLLGRLVRRGALPRGGFVHRAGERGEAEIGDQHLAAPVDHHVRGFQVAMQDALIVRGREAGAEAA